MTALIIDPDLPPITSPVLTPVETVQISEALRILEEARHHADTLRSSTNTAFEQEMQRGYHEGLEKAKAEAAKHHFKTVLSTIRYFDGLEQKFASTLAACLQNLILSMPPEQRLVELARKALQGLKQETRITLRVHPDDLAALFAQMAELRVGLADSTQIELRGDGTLKRGDCVLESPIGVINASLDKQLEVLQQQLTKKS